MDNATALALLSLIFSLHAISVNIIVAILEKKEKRARSKEEQE